MPMPDDFRASELKSFAKAKGTPRPVRVVGGLRGVYLHPDRVRAVEGRNINGTRSQPPAHPAPSTPPPPPLPPDRDPTDRS
jgi:hypothetical protein